MSWRRFEDVLKMSWRRFCNTSWRRLEKVLKHIRLDQDVLKTSWRSLLKTKTKDVFKTSSSRRMFAGMFPRTVTFKKISRSRHYYWDFWNQKYFWFMILTSTLFLQNFKCLEQLLKSRNHQTHVKLSRNSKVVMRKKCPYSKLFWSAFFPHFPVFGLNTERYEVSLRIQSKCGKMETRITPNTDPFCAVICY